MSPSHQTSSPLRKVTALRPFEILLLLFLFAGTALPAFGQLPEIDVQQPAGTPLPDQGSILFGNVSVGSSVTKTVTIRNIGGAVLTGLGVSKTGTAANDYTISGPGAVSLAPNGSTTFTITFTPAQAGGRIAIARISSNDANENPYDINLSGTGASPEISVTQTVNLISGTSTVDFGRANVGSSSTRTFTIRNAGTGNLTNLSANITGSGAFTAPALSETTLSAGDTTNLVVTFTPTSTSQLTGSLRINSNDTDENPFIIALRGSGNIAWLEVEQPAGVPLFSGESIVNFGSTAPGEGVSREFTIRNVGNAPLTNVTTSKTGTDPGDFEAPATVTANIPVGGTFTFTVTFSPTATGDRSAVLEVASTQTAGDPFSVNLTGTAAISDGSDSDDDGTPNLVEYALGTDPLVFDPPPGELVLNGQNLEYTYTRPLSRLSEVGFFLEAADSLEPEVWTNYGEASLTLVTQNDVSQTVKYTIPAGTGRKYVRLRVNRL